MTAAFITEDSYLGDILEPLTLNRYNYCVSNYLNYADPSGHWLEILNKVHDFFQGVTAPVTKSILDTPTALFYPSLILDETLNQGSAGIRRKLDNYDNFTESLVMGMARDAESMTAFYVGRCSGDVLNVLGGLVITFEGILEISSGVGGVAASFSSGVGILVGVPVSLKLIGEGAAVVVVGVQHTTQGFKDFERDRNNYAQSKASESSSGNEGGSDYYIQGRPEGGNPQEDHLKRKEKIRLKLKVLTLWNF